MTDHGVGVSARDRVMGQLRGISALTLEGEQRDPMQLGRLDMRNALLDGTPGQLVPEREVRSLHDEGPRSDALIEGGRGDAAHCGNKARRHRSAKDRGPGEHALSRGRMTEHSAAYDVRNRRRDLVGDASEHLRHQERVAAGG